MKNTIKALLACAAVLCGVWLIIHRRVVAAWFTGSPMPPMPAWHADCCARLRGEDRT